jgi:hypothetical protein
VDERDHLGALLRNTFQAFPALALRFNCSAAGIGIFTRSIVLEKRKQVGGLGARRRNPQQSLDQVMGYAFGANPPCGWIVENMRKKPFSPLLDAA